MFTEPLSEERGTSLYRVRVSVMLSEVFSESDRASLSKVSASVIYTERVTDEELAECVARLRRLGSADARVEVKAAVTDVPRAMWETVSAFANTDGGTIILGLVEDEGFTPAEGFDANRTVNRVIAGLQQDPKIVPVPDGAYRVWRTMVDDAPVVVVEVDSLRGRADTPLPCYVKAKGVMGGSYKRVNDQDRHLSPYEIYILQTSYRPQGTDQEPVLGAGVAELSEDAVRRMLDRIRSTGSHALDHVDPNDTHAALGRIGVLAAKGVPTLAGYLALAMYPQQRYPSLTIDVAVHPSVEKSARGDVRFLDRRVCDGPLPTAIEDAVAAVARNLRRQRRVEGVAGVDELEVPEEVLREAITNAVTHRDYGELARGSQVAVDVFPDRVEVSSPGGFYGTRSAENVAEGRSDSRNPSLARLLTLVPRADGGGVVCENQGSGVPRMMASMRERGLPTPDYSGSDLSGVRVRLSRFGLLDEGVRAWLEGLPGGPYSEHERAALALARRDGRVSVVALRDNLGLDSDVARDVLGALVAEECLIGVGDGPYTLVDSSWRTETSGARWELLSLLDAERAMTIHDLAEATGKSPGALRPLLRELVADGLVVATAPPTSRNRAYLVAG